MKNILRKSQHRLQPLSAASPNAINKMRLTLKVSSLVISNAKISANKKDEDGNAIDDRFQYNYNTDPTPNINIPHQTSPGYNTRPPQLLHILCLLHIFHQNHIVSCT